MIEKFENYIKRFENQEWEEEEDEDEEFDFGDIVICIDSSDSKGELIMGLDYQVMDSLYDGKYITLKGTTMAWDVSRFVKKDD